MMRGMNKLPIARRAKILRLLCEGMSLRSVSRAEDVALNTVTKLLIQAGIACAIYHDENVIGVKASRVQCDEVWSFVGVKQKNRAKSYRAGDLTAGDCWTWTAIDADTKLLVSYMVGGRDAEYAMILMDDLRRRLATRVQLTTDGHHAYLGAVEEAFGADIDYAMLVKLYGGEAGQSTTHERKYSPAECVGTRKETISGSPDKRHVSTSYVERQNLTMRMAMRRFTRLTNAFSKKVENLEAAVALHFTHYNFLRLHRSLRITPAMAAEVRDSLWSMEELIERIDAMAPAPKPRGP